MIGRTISHYRILEKLGQGGMGVVYKAEDITLGRTVALKFLPSDLTRDAVAKERFIQEARAASALDHQNICTIYEVAQTEDGRTFIAMAYYEGEDLKSKIERGPLKLDEALDISLQIAQGLAKAHGRGIVHRDIKPANILITKDGLVKIVDFGLAKLAGTKITKTGMTLGTAQYMSPEQARGEEVDARSDIFSLGAVLYEMLTGKRAFPGEYDQATLYAIMNEEPPPLTALRSGVPMELERIVKKALAKKSSERYQHADDLIVDLKGMARESASSVARSAVRAPDRRSRRVLRFALPAAIVVAVAAAFFYFHQRSGTPMDSIAILPFTNVYANPDLDYLSDGMSESIIRSLSGITSLKRIIAYSSVLRYKQKEIDPRSVGRELGVDALLLGRISKRGDELTISVELVNTKQSTRMWGEQYTESFARIFDVRDKISESIAGNLRLRLTPNDMGRLTKRPTGDTDAYEDYLKGKYFVDRRSQADLARSFDYFRMAIARDPKFALPYAGLGDYYMTMGMYNLLPKETAYPLAKTNLMKALELDPMESETYALLADFKEFCEWDWAGAQEMLARALELNPFNAFAHHRRSHMLTEVKRFDEATAEMKRALELEPLTVPTNACFGQNLYLARRYDEAIDQLWKTIELDSTHYDAHGWLGIAYFQKGMRQEGIRKMEEASGFEVIGARMAGALSYAYAVEGRREASRVELRKLLEKSGTSYYDPYFVVWAYVGLGDRDSAFVWLQQSYDERSIFLRELIPVDPWLDTLHSDERFGALMKKMGFGI